MDHHTVIGTQAVDGGLLHFVQQGGDWAGPQPAHAPPRCTKCNSAPINSQCTNIILFDVELELPLESKELNKLIHLTRLTYYNKEIT